MAKAEFKSKALAFMTILILALTGCGKAEQKPLRVYSFSGENEQFAVSNGIIAQSSWYGNLYTKGIAAEKAGYFCYASQ